MRRALISAAFLLLSSCAVMDRQRAAIAPDDLEFHNLEVLPVNITREELIETMRGFTRALGVRCEHCHVKTADQPKVTHDFASDAKPEKEIARAMIRMTRQINSDTIQKVGRNGMRVTCNTCHRGKPLPET